MKMSGNERISRSFALEQTYVHEVYEKYYDNPRSKPWPKVQEFLEKIEPGALVCDVGCGNGKYLKVNMSIYNLGAEKSFRLSNLARQNENEVIRLDNLALPFKDNCFDSVLSLSVIHHFATTDRRVSALREMTRVLRVGGRMIITVWAMEQEHRKFESQDVLVPWKRPRPIRTCELSETQSSDNDDIQTHDIFSNLHQETDQNNKSFRFRDTFRKKSRTAAQHQPQQRNNNKYIPMDPLSYRKTSSGSSTLSSPSETCYGFVKRALQKIAGGGRRVVANSWFLDNWIACMHKQQPLHKKYDSDGCEYCECSGSDNPEDQPIELLRIDDEEPKQISRRLTCPVSQMSADIDAFKSRSMNNIRTLPKTSSTKTNISSTNKVQLMVNQNKENSAPICSARNNTQLKKPKLVKQKKSVCDEFEAEDEVEALDQPTDMKNLIRTMPDFKLSRYDSRGAILKQRSLNEDILSTDRLREKERLKQNIQKQTSLNEELIFKRTPTFESLRESFFAVTSSKGFQLFKNGLTNRIKNSTTMEKVATTSLKNGFVKIFQTWKGTELKSPTSSSTKDNELFKGVQNSVPSESNEKEGERRHSKEDGSDSSKDSSLQSDTSVDSEDSFASVIFVPKSDPMSPIGGAINNLSAGPASPLCRASCQSAPQSPRIKQSSCPTSPRIKQIPNGMHPLTKQLSSPKPSTDFLPVLNTLFPFNNDDKMRDNSRLAAPQTHQIVPLQPTRKDLAQKYSVGPIPQFKKTTRNTAPNPIECLNNAPNDSINSESSTIKQINTVINVSTPENNNNNAEVSRTEKLKKIREILAQKPEFGIKSKSHCPIVKKISDPEKKDQSLVKPIPKLLKFEIFNPIEDDDSDNSCVSSPDSTESINSVRSVDKFKYPNDDDDANINKGKSLNLLETAANITMNNSQETVEKVINTRTKQLPNVDVFSILQRRFSSDTEPLIEENEEYCEESRRSSNTWNEECHKHLTAFADKLSEKLMKELDEYQLTMENIDDPYIHRLSEELHDLSILSEEIKKQNEYLTKFAQKPNNKTIISRKCVKCKKLPECECTLPLPLRTHHLLNRTNCDNRVVNQKNVRLPCDVNNINNSVNNSVVFTNNTNNNNHRLNNEYGINIVHKFDENLSRNLSDTHHGDQFDGELNEGTMKNSIVVKGSSSDSFDSSEKGSSSNSLLSSGATSINFAGQSIASSVTDLTERDSRDCCSNEGSTASLVSIESKGRNLDRLTPGQLKRRDQSGLSDISADSWPPDEIGGEITYHRYYHVFRQGELEKLIEKYVDDLHVVSSSYEHASWCIIAEKVQIWTI